MNFDTQIQCDELEENIMECNESMPCAPTTQKTLYYEEPTQVKFVDFESDSADWHGGIAYQDVIICGCCGGPKEIREIYEDAADFGEGNPIVELPWTSISETIREGEYAYGY